MKIVHHGRAHWTRIHTGHLLLGEFAFEEFKLDEIWFLPNGNPPHKDTEDIDTSLTHRIEMVKARNRHDFPAILSFPCMRRRRGYHTRIGQCVISMNCIRATSFILFWGRILCFPLNNGSISKRFSQPAPYLRRCGMTRMWEICRNRLLILKRNMKPRLNCFGRRYWRFLQRRSGSGPRRG